MACPWPHEKWPPRSPASRGPLPPEGALFILGRPGDEKGRPGAALQGVAAAPAQAATVGGAPKLLDSGWLGCTIR